MEKKSCYARARSAYKLLQNVCLETWTNKISYLVWQEKLIHEKKSRFARAARPQRDELREVAFYVVFLWLSHLAFEFAAFSQTCGVVDLRSSDALRRETKYVNAQ